MGAVVVVESCPLARSAAAAEAGGRTGSCGHQPIKQGQGRAEQAETSYSTQGGYTICRDGGRGGGGKVEEEGASVTDRKKAFVWDRSRSGLQVTFGGRGAGGTGSSS